MIEIEKVQDGVSGAHDQVYPQTHQGSSCVSHEIEHWVWVLTFPLTCNGADS